MYEEVSAAVNFLVNLLAGSGRISRECCDRFRDNIERKLKEFYTGHWFPELPHKGSGYRCIRINHSMDPLLDSAAVDSGIKDLISYLPNELTMWVDPFDVSYRFGENGSIGQVYGADSSSSSSSSDDETDRDIYNQSPVYYGRSSPVQVQSYYTPSSMYSSCKQQLRGMSESKHGNMFTAPFAAFVSS